MPFGFFKKKTKEAPKSKSTAATHGGEEPDKYKVVFIGGISPGKSQIVNRLVGSDFDPDITSTIAFVYVPH